MDRQQQNDPPVQGTQPDAYEEEIEDLDAPAQSLDGIAGGKLDQLCNPSCGASG